MLQLLSIQNYAIIQKLEVSFENGFSVITGETGAGKSIILGAISLILGQRAETNVLKDESQKCVVEGRFVAPLTDAIDSILKENDLDFDSPIIFRREISPSGKTRAFVNDTPVSLSVMRDLGLHLIDIHSQHSNLELGKKAFQLNVIDWFGAHGALLENYQQSFNVLKKLEKEYEALKENAAKEKSDFDYHLFQFKQLDEAKLEAGEQVKLEEELEMLVHSEEIKEGLGFIVSTFEGEEFATLAKTKEAASALNKLKNYLNEAVSLYQRLDSVYFELRDIVDECQRLMEATPNDQERLVLVRERLDTIYTLQQKHRVLTVEELIVIRDLLNDKLQLVASFDEAIAKYEKEIVEAKEFALKQANELRHSRLAAIPQIEAGITSYLSSLGMPNARFRVELEELNSLSNSGIDEAIFLFCANKGGKLEEISKVASGGEMSRLMLAIKTVVAKSKALPAIIFDEIDTGISGEIAVKMAEILKQISQYMQVINITHLPQIASKGDQHYWVFKKETAEGVETGMRVLTKEERVSEIAKMLGGEKPTEAAIANAKSLLGSQV